MAISIPSDPNHPTQHPSAPSLARQHCCNFLRGLQKLPENKTMAVISSMDRVGVETKVKISNPPPLQTWSYRTYRAIQAPLISNTLMLLRSQVCHKCQIYPRFHRIWRIILKMTSSAHCSSIWNFNRFSWPRIKKGEPNAFNAAAPHCACRWGKWCSGAFLKACSRWPRPAVPSINFRTRCSLKVNHMMHAL